MKEDSCITLMRPVSFSLVMLGVTPCNANIKLCKCKLLRGLIKCEASRVEVCIVCHSSCERFTGALGNTRAQVVGARIGITPHQEGLINSDTFHLRGRDPVSTAFQCFLNRSCSDSRSDLP